MSRRIDPDKVLLIVNTDTLDSVAGTEPANFSRRMADFYISQRGLTEHILEFSLGTLDVINIPSDQTAFYNDVLVPIANYIEQNNIECLIASAGCPGFINDGRTYRASFENVLACSKWHKRIGNYAIGELSLAQANSPDPQYISKTTIDYGVATSDTWFVVDHNWRNSVNVVAFGRLGLASYGDGVDETSTVTQRCVIDAMASEKTYLNAPDTMIGVELLGSSITTRNYAEIQDDMGGRGIGSKSAVGSWLAWGINKPPENYPTNQAQQDAAIGDQGTTGNYVGENGNALSPSQPMWGFIGSVLRNLPNPAWISGFSVQRGGWVYEATSLGRARFADVITAGGCAGAGTVDEPLNTNVLMPRLFVSRLLKGYTMAEAAILSNNLFNWQNTVTGDPLYAPFGAEVQPVDANTVEFEVPVTLTDYTGITLTKDGTETRSPVSHTTSGNDITFFVDWDAPYNGESVQWDYTGTGNLVAVSDGTPVELTSLALTPCAGPPSDYPGAVIADGAVHFWKLDEPSGASAADSVGARTGTHNLVTTGLAPLVTDSVASAFYRETDNSVTRTTTPLPMAGDFSWECWFTTTNSTNTIRIMDSRGTGASQIGVQISHTSAATDWGNMLIDDGAGNTIDFSSVPYNEDDGAVHCIVLTFDNSAGTAVLYIDGVLKDTITNASLAGIDFTTTRDFVIGSNPNTSQQSWDGNIDMVATYELVLTQTQVTDHYTKGTA